MSFISTLQEMFACFTCTRDKPAETKTNTINNDVPNRSTFINSAEDKETNKENKNVDNEVMVGEETMTSFIERNMEIFAPTYGGKNLFDVWEVYENTNFLKLKKETDDFKLGEKKCNTYAKLYGESNIKEIKEKCITKDTSAVSIDTNIKKESEKIEISNSGNADKKICK